MHQFGVRAAYETAEILADVGRPPTKTEVMPTNQFSTYWQSYFVSQDLQ